MNNTIFLRDFYFYYFLVLIKILVHLKLQTCFVLPGLFSAIRSLKKNPKIEKVSKSVGDAAELRYFRSYVISLIIT